MHHRQDPGIVPIIGRHTLSAGMGPSMHMLASIALVFCAILVLALGLVSVLRDLLAKGPYVSPRIKDDKIV